MIFTKYCADMANIFSPLTPYLTSRAERCIIYTNISSYVRGMKRMRKGKIEVMKKLSLSGVRPDTLIRTLVLAAALLNQILMVAGKNPLPFSDTELYEYFSLTASVASSLWAWWKNNSFTSAAQAADEYMKEVK